MPSEDHGMVKQMAYELSSLSAPEVFLAYTSQPFPVADVL
jgi:hypothetical protein